jgi:hypothetical protein
MSLILSGTDGLSDVDGTAATPAIRGTDANTGIFFPAADTVGMSTGGSERMRIDSAGNVGIGSTPTAILAYKVLEVNGTSGAYIALKQGGTEYGNIYNNSTDGTAISASGARNIIFQTNAAERMRIDSSGNLLFATTSSNPMTGGPAIQLLNTSTNPQINVISSQTANANTNFLMYSSGASAYRFYVGWGGTVYATSTTITGISDQRLKENIRDLDDGLEKVLSLKPRKFDWKEGKGADIKDARGFIAQEFEIVFPDMVEEWKDPAPEGEEPYKAVNANLIPTLVKAIQEMKSIIDTQASTILSLTTRISALETK